MNARQQSKWRTETSEEDELGKELIISYAAIVGELLLNHLLAVLYTCNSLSLYLYLSGP